MRYRSPQARRRPSRHRRLQGAGRGEHDGGYRASYTAESRSLAILETLVNFEGTERRRLPPCVLFEARFDARLVEIVEPAVLPPGWHAYPATPSARELGDRWVVERRTAVLRVPSVVTRGEFNYLLNPSHPDFERIEVRPPESVPWDARL